MKFTKNLITRFIFKLFIACGLMLMALHLSAFASNLPGIDSGYFVNSNLPAPPEGKSGQDLFIDVVLSAVSYTKTIAAVLGVFFVTLTGVKLVVMGADEDAVSTAKTGITYSVVAFMLLSMSEDLAKIFDMSTGTVIGSPQEILKRVNIFEMEITIIVTFVKYIIGAFATVTFVRAGVKLVTNGDDEEAQSEAKGMLLYTVMALLMLYVGEIFITKVFYKVNTSVYSGITGVHPQFDAKEGIDQIVGITNFVVGFLGPVAVLALIVGGVYYAVAAGDEEQMERAKRIVVSAFIGVVIIYGAFAIVSTVLAGKLENIGAIT